MKAYDEAEVYYKEKNWLRAVTFYDRSIRWYTPLNPFIEKSARRLWEIGGRAEEEGDIRMSLMAYRTIRRGLLAASGFSQPGKEWIRKSDEKIRALTNEKAKMEHRMWTKDQVPGHPDIFWTIVLEIGLFGWILSTITFIVFGLKTKRGEEKVDKFHLVLWLSLVCFFFSLWIWGMMKA
jgi:hypothetical protein